jgi:hypothetical protein
MPVDITTATVAVAGSTLPTAVTTNASNISTNTTNISNRVQLAATAEQSVTHTLNMRKWRINNDDDSESDAATAYATFDGTDLSYFVESTEYFKIGSSVFSLLKDGSFADTYGMEFAGSTAPGVTTNKLYRSGNELFYDGSDITGAISTNATNIGTLQSQNPDWGSYTTLTDTLGVSGWNAPNTSSLKYVVKGKILIFSIEVSFGANSNNSHYVNSFPWNAAFEQNVSFSRTNASTYPFTVGNAPDQVLFTGSAMYFYKNGSQLSNVGQAGDLRIYGTAFLS